MPLKQRTPLRQTGFRRKPGSPFSNFASPKTRMQRSTLKARIKKPTVEEGSKYLAACRNEPCYLRVLGVCIGMETVVPCHSNQSRHGKGGGLKAKHVFSVPGCRACHEWIDQGKAPRALKFSTWDRAYERWEPVRAAKMGLTEEITDEA